MTSETRRGRAWSNRCLLWVAIASLAIGFGPMAANILSSQIASALGCYITEFSVYSKSGTPNDFFDDVPGCRLGTTDVGPLLVNLHTFVFAFLLTWPFLVLSAFLWIMLILRWVKKPSG
jgi:hypothetical protein